MIGEGQVFKRRMEGGGLGYVHGLHRNWKKDCAKEKEAFEREIRRRDVTDSFIMIPRQKPEEIPKLLACCDAAFLSFRDEELWERTIPAKLQSYMACGMPIIAAVKGEAEWIIREAGCGGCVQIGDVTELVMEIRKMATLLSAELKQLGENGEIYCRKYFNKEVLMDEIGSCINRNIMIKKS